MLAETNEVLKSIDADGKKKKTTHVYLGYLHVVTYLYSSQALIKIENCIKALQGWPYS